ncbi:Putative peptidoglycan binding domain-containing protein [Caballeronia arationis]|jgi:peptidoglycan hydrolase-like protein with peptidoglycan-binding domain|uniref:Peptidoglycan binding domain-containing protein n=1 Tax=Caballeronia arationis TaxID=1777142 RepID=A0A7Z7IC64_9BURK|nr:N-acetylmuramidase domain-containing protein [Caballeronia arationis]SOE87950.1 Putative peptidoglycan binding domain-containing protein [Caballeronia arationis]
MSALPPNINTAKAKLIQRALNEKTGANLVVDGQFGPKSVSALCVYQSKNHLSVTSLYDAATQAYLEPFIAQKYLTLAAYQKAAQRLGVDVATVQTVCQVETSGAGFLNDGRCAILFERHQLYRTLQTVMSQAQLNQLVAQYPNLINPDPGGYLGGTQEWDRLNQAEAILQQHGAAPGLAMRSASWGLFQIMGYYYVHAGYKSVEDYVAAMAVSEANQLDAFCDFLEDMNAGGMITALRARDWTSFAIQYNGKNQSQNNYDGRLAGTYKSLTS